MSHEIIANDLVTILKSKVTLTSIKLAYFGMCILNLSKVLMYEFHYHYIKNKHDNSLRLLFTNTDTLIYEIKAEDVYEDFSKDKEVFVFSNYSSKSKYYDKSNKPFVGKRKMRQVVLQLKNLSE